MTAQERLQGAQELGQVRLDREREGGQDHRGEEVGGSHESRIPATIESQTTRFCGARTAMTDAEIVSMVRHAVTGPDHVLTDEPFGAMRLGAVCDLGEAHSGAHASLQALPGYAQPYATPWLRWDDQHREIMWTGDMDCPYVGQAEVHVMDGPGGCGDGMHEAEAPGGLLVEIEIEDDLRCMLFLGHPGTHLVWDLGALGPTPSFMLHKCEVAGD